MQQWEYLFVTFESRAQPPNREPDWYLSYASNQKVSPQSAPTIHTYTNERGAEGWQLFSSHYAFRADKPTLLRLIFRRMLEPAEEAPRHYSAWNQSWDAQIPHTNEDDLPSC